MRRKGTLVRGRASGASLIVGMLLAAPAMADAVADRAHCSDWLMDQAVCIAACTRLIDSGDAKDGDLAYLYSRRSDAHRRLGEFEKAMAAINEAIRIAPETAANYNLRIRLLQSKGRMDEARADAETSVRLTSATILRDPTDVAALRQRAAAHAFLERFDEAILDIRRVIELAPDRASHWLLRGYYRQLKDDHELAIVDITEAIRLDPIHYYEQRGASYERLGDYEKALADYGKQIEIQPDRWAGYWRRAYLNWLRGNSSVALADIERAASINPRIPEIQQVLGIVYHDIGRHAEAIVALTRAIDGGESSPYAHYARGHAYELAGDIEPAIADYKRALATKDWRKDRADRAAHELAAARLDALGARQ